MTSLARATAVMTVGTIISRVTGVLRLAALASALGIAESRLPDTYNIANTAPNILYELVLGGVMTSVFVPVFVELLEKEGRERAWEVASGIINLSLAALTGITTLGILAAPWIARFYASRLEGDAAAIQQDVVTFLLRLFLPQMIFYGVYFLAAGLLNAHKRFGPPMYTPILNNLTVIGVFIAFHQAYGAVTLGTVGTAQLVLIGVGTTAGVAVSALSLLPFLRGLGRYRLRFGVDHPAVRKLARLSVFVIGYVIVNQVGYLIVQWLANAQQGGYSAYVSAFTFFMLPHGLFAVSLATALLPTMSEHAVAQRWDRFRERLSVGIRSTLFLVLPAAVGYFVLAEPVIRLLLEHGVMTPQSTTLVTSVLRFFVLGLVPFSIFQLLLRAFYALQDTRTPFLVNCGAVALNIAVNVPLFHVLGVQGLAMGHALSYVFGTTLLARGLGRRIGGLDGRAIATSAARITGAAGGMGIAVWVIARWSAPPDGASLVSDLIAVVVPVAVGAAVYLGLAVAFKVRELAFVRDLFMRRRGGKAGSAPGEGSIIT